jgi:MFS transporter, putative metabolite:H+ symporter
VYAPESPRWLLDQGRAEEARRVIAWLLERPLEEIPPGGTVERHDPGSGFRGLFRYRSSVLVTVLAWLGASAAVSGMFLWGPTFLEQVLGIGSDEAAALFVVVILGSFLGRLFFSFFPQRSGRRVCGLLMGFGAPPLLAVTAFSGQSELAGASLFVIALACAAFFVDGGFANLAPYTSEVYPTSMRTQGMGLAWTASGIGRIVGPLGVALIAGTGDLVDPEATLAALKPGFLYLAGFSLLVGLGFLLVRFEPHGSDLETLSADLIAQRRTGPAVE